MNNNQIVDLIFDIGGVCVNGMRRVVDDIFETIEEVSDRIFEAIVSEGDDEPDEQNEVEQDDYEDDYGFIDSEDEEAENLVFQELNDFSSAMKLLFNYDPTHFSLVQDREEDDEEETEEDSEETE